MTTTEQRENDVSFWSAISSCWDIEFDTNAAKSIGRGIARSIVLAAFWMKSRGELYPPSNGGYADAPE